MTSFGVSNTKWRWYILFWDVGDILTNACIIYMIIRNMNGTPRKHRLSRHCFINSIEHALINSEKYSV